MTIAILSALNVGPRSCAQLRAAVEGVHGKCDPGVFSRALGSLQTDGMIAPVEWTVSGVTVPGFMLVTSVSSLLKGT